jgi:hypothetical protein
MLFEKGNLLAAAFASLLLIAGSSAGAQTPVPPKGDSSVIFGGTLSVSTIISALQNSGYQALAIPIPPNLPLVIGALTTGVGGLKVIIMATKCPNGNETEVCALTFATSFNDQKKIINNTLAELNSKANLGKVLSGTRPDGTITFNEFYVYPCKGIDDTKFVSNVLVEFSTDVSRMLAAYQAMGNPPATNPPPANH